MSLEKDIECSLATATKVLRSQAAALKHLAHQHAHSPFAREEFAKALRVLLQVLRAGGKIVVSGIGKSHKIAAKLVATLHSLSISAALLHPAEALHGDLGIISPASSPSTDCLLLVSASGASPELVTLLRHAPQDTPAVLLTSKRTSPLAQLPQVAALLFAELPPHLAEQELYGLTAPTISTTQLLALGDAAAIALAELHVPDYTLRRRLFAERHPGGAIGEAYAGTITPGTGRSSPSVTSDVSSAKEFYPTKMNLDDDRAVIQDLVDYELSEKVQNSKSIGELSSLEFEDETSFLQLVTLYDYLVYHNSSLAVETFKLKEAYKAASAHDYQNISDKLLELNWRVKQNLSKVAL